MKKALIIVGGILAALVVAALVIPGFLNWNQYKTQIENAVEAATGRDVAIGGDISLAILPAPAFSVKKLTLANIPGGAEPEMVSLDALDVRVRLLPLLRGEIDVDKIVLVAPRISLEVLPDGRRNWDLTAQDKAPAEEAGGGLGADVRVNRFVIEDGIIVYRDALAGTDEKIEALNAVVSADSLAGPFKIKGDLVVRETPLAFAASVGQTGNGKIPVSLDLTLSGANADAAFRGLVDPAEPRSAEGTFKVKGKNLGALVAALSSAVTGEPIELAVPQPVTFDAAFVGSGTGVRTTALVYSVGTSRGEGHIAASWEGAPQFDVELSFGTLDADELIPVSGETEAGPGGDGVALPDPAMLLPGEVGGRVALSAEAVRYKGRVMRQVKLAARADKGRLDIEQIGALLPGGADLKLAGQVTGTPEKARFDGKIDATANNLRGLLEWLEVESEGLEAGRLSSFAVNGGLYLTRTEAGVRNALVRLDTANFKGDAAVRPGTPFGVTVKGTLDRLDLGYYLPKGAKCFESSGEESKSDPLGAFEGDVVLSIGRFSCPETRIDGLAVDAAVKGGVLALRKVSADKALGLKLAASGRVKGLTATPEFDLTLDAGGTSLSEVEQLFPDLLPWPAAKLGSFGYSGKIAGTPRKIATEGTLDLGGTTLAGRANVALKPADKKDGASGLDSLDATFKLNAASLARFIAQWDLPLTPSAARDDRPLEMGGTVAGSMASMKLDLKGRIAEAGLAAKGTVNHLDDTPTYDLAFDLDGKDIKTFLRGIGVDFQPADPRLGPVKVKANLSGGAESLAVKIPSGQAGPVVFNGATTVTFAGERPNVAGDFRAGDVPLDRFMAPTPKDAKTKTGDHQWSREPFNNAWLETFDANFRVRADSVTLKDYRFEQPKFTLAVSNGVLEVRDLTGKLFDGDVALGMRYGGKKVSDLALNLSLANASLEKAMGTAIGVNAVTGTIGFKSELKSAGASPYDLVRALNGATRISLNEGIVRGIDLPKISQNMKAMKNVEAFGRVLGSALAGGSTRHKGFDTTVTTEDGAFNLNNLVVELDAGKALLGGRVDLFKWLVGANGRLQLTEHPLAPPIGFDIGGGLSSPTVNYQTKEIKRYMAAEIGKALLNKSTGGGLDQLLGIPKKTEPAAPDAVPATPGEQPPGEQPAKEPAAKEEPAMQLFKGILDSLNKKEKKPAE